MSSSQLLVHRRKTVLPLSRPLESGLQKNTSPMLDSKVFICSSAAELQRWMQHIEDRKYKSTAQPMSPSHCALSYLLPCDEHWKREELKKYLLQAPIWQWEGSPIQHMGQPGYTSIVHIINTQRQGRLPRHSIKAVERFALPGRLEFELTGELVEPLQVSCTCEEDYRNWMFQLQQPDRSRHAPVTRGAPPLMPKLQRSRKESQEAAAPAGQRHVAEASAATGDFFHVGFGEPAPFPVGQSDAFDPAWWKEKNPYGLAVGRPGKTSLEWRNDHVHHLEGKKLEINPCSVRDDAVRSTHSFLRDSSRQSLNRWRYTGLVGSLSLDPEMLIVCVSTSRRSPCFTSQRD
ncbi:hypothetical protein EYF80_052098 [Liparis tanakae]|uniref:PH domain-containing protein n=1 Tax=Liparis tanakae TaxID=230148 RepID=A0A4Z2F984_9TELE|nr:hypothetical protein EYF80_052098 [Liparis tanakae]